MGTAPIKGGLSRAAWPTGVQIDITYSSNCHSPVTKVTNNVGRELNFGFNTGNGAIGC
jgi:adenosylcobinamide amidohydrolase